MASGIGRSCGRRCQAGENDGCCQHRFPELASFAAQLEEKKASYSPEARQRLVADLRAQYAELGTEVPPAVAANLDLLARDTTFTITTG
ncbi:MAG: bacillithiol biosynthesis BshC, partial [Verrucomicrobiaceae bacterium]